MHTIEGNNTCSTNEPAFTFPAIHNIVVVTSPIGDQAPPALALIIIKPANQSLVSRSLITFCRIVINTIVAVRLSIIADKIKASIENIQSNFRLLLVFIYPLIVAKPSK